MQGVPVFCFTINCKCLMFYIFFVADLQRDVVCEAAGDRLTACGFGGLVVFGGEAAWACGGLLEALLWCF